MSNKYRESKEVLFRGPRAPSSRYKNARFYQRRIKGIGSRIEPESWVPPDIKPSEDDLVTEVGAGEIGRLDLVSLRVYGLDSLWWVIAYINDIVDPFEEVVSGMTLRYPPFSEVAAKVLA